MRFAFELSTSRAYRIPDHHSLLTLGYYKRKTELCETGCKQSLSSLENRISVLVFSVIILPLVQVLVEPLGAYETLAAQFTLGQLPSLPSSPSFSSFLSLSLFLSLTPSLSHSRRNTITSIVLDWPSSRTLPAPLRHCILYQQMQLLTYFKQPSSYDPPPPPAILEICIAFGMACVCLPT